MKKNEKQIIEEVEKTLQSMDNTPILNENPFFYLKLKTEIENEDVILNTGRAANFILRPAVLIFILIINIITAVFYFNSSLSKTNTDELLINTLHKEYTLENNYLK
jgi:hypothetical protein